MKSSVVFVSPEKAKIILEQNISNRPVRQSWVKQLSEAIKRGEWKTTHQGVAISKTGTLIDGQHRLMAIVLSGIGCHLSISTEVDDDSVVCMDIGAKRNTNDIFQIGIAQAEVIRFAAKLIYSGAPTPQQIGKLIGSPWHDSTNLLQEYCSASVKIYSSAPMRLAAVFRHVGAIGDPASQDVVFSQYKALCLHDFDSMDSTSKSYVRAIMSSGKGGIIDQTTRFIHGMKVFNPKMRSLEKFRVLDSEYTQIGAMARGAFRTWIGE